MGSKLLENFVFVHLLLQQEALRKELSTAPLRERFSDFEKFLLINFISNCSKLLKHFIFTHLQSIEDYGKCAKRKQPVIVTFVERFKTATLRKSYCKSHWHLLQIA